MDKRTRQRLMTLLRTHRRFVIKNLKQSLRNWYTLRVKKSRVVPPYSAVFYVSHRCNLECSYCTQKVPDVISEELPTERTLELLGIIRKEVDYLLFTGGEPLLRPDIVELARHARLNLKFNSVMLITNGTHLREREEILDYLTSMVVSLDSIKADRRRPATKPFVVEKVLANLLRCKEIGKPAGSQITVNSVITRDNLEDIEDILDFCLGHGFFFSTQSAMADRYPDRSLLENPRYRRLVERIIAEREKGRPVNGTPRLLRTLLYFQPFHCYPTMFPRVYPNGDVFYPCEPLKTIAGNLFVEGSFKRIFERGKKLYGDIPFCPGVCYLFGNVMSHYYVEQFRSFASDSIR